MRPPYWILTVTVALAAYWLLSQQLNLIVAIIVTAWVSSLPALFGILASDDKAGSPADHATADPAE